ncbi:MAG: hypothetical protein J5819_00255 [Eubacterium sp.]|nr:hypothetical protein [Eubacterium sp.]
MEEDGRKTTISVSYNKKNVSRSLKSYIESLEYTDVATGGSDQLTLNLDNQDMRFLRKWKPLKGAKISSTITINNWDKQGISKSFKTGAMVVDDLTASGPANTFQINAVSSPVKGSFKDTNRKKTYKNATIETIASKIAKRAGVKLHYEAGKIKIKEIEQSDQPDSTFLKNLCEDYGLGIKIYNDKIVIYDEVKYEKKSPLVTIYRSEKSKEVGKDSKHIGGVIDWNWNTTMQRTYTGVTVTYTDSKNNKKHKAKVGKDGRRLKLNVSAFNKNDAKLKADAALRAENKKRTTMALTIEPDPRLIATGTIALMGFGKGSGKYFIDEAVHSIDEDGYVLKLTLHKVLEKKKPQAGGGIEDTDPTGGGGA